MKTEINEAQGCDMTSDIQGEFFLPVTVVTGSYPPEVCGVGDYTCRLIEAAPSNWRLFKEGDWSLKSSLGIFSRFLSLQPRNAIIQYPTQGYGWSVLPHILTVFGKITRRYRSTWVLHEYMSLSKKSRLMLDLVSHFLDLVIFTTEHERAHARAQFLFSDRVKTTVIPILSNIPRSPSLLSFANRANDLAYFGHIRPNKGLEVFLEIASMAKNLNSNLNVSVFGEVPAGYEQYACSIKRDCAENGIDIRIGLSDEAVADELANVKILYLPFKDGVSARRGSVLAGLSNGALIAATVGKATPTEMKKFIFPCSGNLDDVGILLSALKLPDSEAYDRQILGQQYLDSQLPRNWAGIVYLYQNALAGIS